MVKMETPYRVGPRINRDKADCRDGSSEDRKTPAHTGTEGWDGKSTAGSLAPATFIDIKGGQNHKKCYLRAMNREDIYRGRKAKSAWQRQAHKGQRAVHSAEQELGELLSTLTTSHSMDTQALRDTLCQDPEIP